MYFYTFYTVHCSIITNENQKRYKWYIFSQSVALTDALLDYHTVHTLVHSAHTSTHDILNNYTQLFNIFNYNFNYQRTTRCLDCG
jgi:hypothetical protein